MVWIDPVAYADTLQDLDHLEGYRPDRPAQSHYVRVQRTAMYLTPGEAGTGKTSHRVWMYEAGPRFHRDHYPRIDNGDWVTERAQPRTQTGAAGITPAEEFRIALDPDHQAALTIAHETNRLLTEPNPEQPYCPQPDLYLNTVGLTETHRPECNDDDGSRWRENNGG